MKKLRKIKGTIYGNRTPKMILISLPKKPSLFMVIQSNRTILSKHRRYFVMPIPNGGHGMKKGGIFTSKFSLPGCTPLFPVLLLAHEKMTELSFNYIPEIPFS